jgi:hypothetical protein
MCQLKVWDSEAQSWIQAYVQNVEKDRFFAVVCENYSGSDLEIQEPEWASEIELPYYMVCKQPNPCVECQRLISDVHRNWDTQP